VPTSLYVDKHGERLPSVTQILGVAWAKPALVAWAHREGVAGRPLNKARDDAAEAGTAAHELILARMGGPPADLTRYSKEAGSAARISDHHAQGWVSEHTFEPVVVETALVSTKMGYGGTPDWYGLLDGIPTVLDLKTGGLYPEQLVQAAAYRLLLIEAGHKVDRLLLLRAPRTLSGHPETLERMGEEAIGHYTRGWNAAMEMYAVRRIIGD